MSVTFCHINMDRYAEAFNQGYEAAVAQHIAPDDRVKDATDWMEEQKRGAIRAALIQAAMVMPIETLHGADGASVWLRDYADRFGGESSVTNWGDQAGTVL